MKRGQLDNTHAQAELRKRAKLRDEQKRRDLIEVLSLPAGRRFFWRLLNDDLHLNGSQLSLNAIQNAIFEGQRDVGVALLVRAQELAPRQALQMVQEHAQAAFEDLLAKETAQRIPHPETEAESDGSDTKEQDNG